MDWLLDEMLWAAQAVFMLGVVLGDFGVTEQSHCLDRSPACRAWSWPGWVGPTLRRSLIAPQCGEVLSIDW